jgi:hypothetical protein
MHQGRGALPCLAERRFPSPSLRRAWTEDARQRLEQALDRAWADGELGVAAAHWVVRGEPGLVLSGLADSPGDLLVVGSGRPGWLLRHRTLTLDDALREWASEKQSHDQRSA